MNRIARTSLVLAVFALALPLAAAAQHDHHHAAPAPATVAAATAFDRLAALAGTWVAADVPGLEGPVTAEYRLSANGSAVFETLFAGTPHEMVTVYHRDGNDLVLTHYCAAGNQPRMRAKTLDGDVLAFEFDGGTNLDPAKDVHMHSARIELVSMNEVRAEWQGWSAGQADANHLAKLHLTRKN